MKKLKVLIFLCAVVTGVESLVAMGAHDGEVKAADPVVMDIDMDVDMHVATDDHALVTQILTIAESMAARATQTALQPEINPALLGTVNTRAQRMFSRSIKSANKHNNNMRNFKGLLAQLSNAQTQRSIADLEKQLRQNFCRYRHYNSVQEAVADVQTFYAQMVHGIFVLTQV